MCPKYSGSHCSQPIEGGERQPDNDDDGIVYGGDDNGDLIGDEGGWPLNINNNNNDDNDLIDD